MVVFIGVVVMVSCLPVCVMYNMLFLYIMSSLSSFIGEKNTDDSMRRRL